MGYFIYEVQYEFLMCVLHRYGVLHDSDSCRSLRGENMISSGIFSSSYYESSGEGQTLRCRGVIHQQMQSQEGLLMNLHVRRSYQRGYTRLEQRLQMRRGVRFGVTFSGETSGGSRQVRVIQESDEFQPRGESHIQAQYSSRVLLVSRARRREYEK